MIVAVPRDHTHAGVHYKKGMLVDLPDEDVAWLLRAERLTRERLVSDSSPAADSAGEPETTTEHDDE